MPDLKNHEIVPICDTLLEGNVKNCYDFFYYRNYYKDILDSRRVNDFMICDVCSWFYKNYCYKKGSQLDTDLLSCDLFNFPFPRNFRYKSILSVYIDGNCQYDCWWCINRCTEIPPVDFDFDKFDEVLATYPHDTVLINSFSDPLRSDPEVIHTIIDICEKHDKYVDIISHDYLLDKFDLLDRIRTLYLVCYREWYDKEKELCIEYALGICNITLVFPVIPDRGILRRDGKDTHNWYFQTILKWYPLVDNIEIREVHFTDKYLVTAARIGFKRLVEFFISRKFTYINKLKAVPYTHNTYYYYFPDGSIYDDPFGTLPNEGFNNKLYLSEFVNYDRRLLKTI